MLSSFPAFFAFGCLSGATTVLFGFGGGFVVVPVVYGFAFVNSTPADDAMHVAVATSTAVMMVNSLTATAAHWRSGLLQKEYVWPLALFVGIGGGIGALAATLVDEGVLRALFIAYLAVTIIDSLVRKGFLAHGTEAVPRPLGPFTATTGGIGIGAVAGFLGVGGSVMTVPLLRRKGLAMAGAAAMANPLSAPVAAVGTIVYAFASTGAADALGGGYLGFIDLTAAAALLAGSLPTIAVVRRVAGPIPDRAHAIAYIGLLTVVLVVMLLG
ncbi:sulfite exporter TauE/SafE family protein [Nocardiopsis ansamitocini]|uniref:Probable membrane transporter protein n=1 Tax=Nocardiopsis ansamitocini TaxID=1670832 RepID=A0A9W6PA34_9ACTN|nr:sulfite exporter TauE/SafE family protein [Nocardiopsis ansamitocini]GLU49809.1 UPF0721 transmembrane protein [Nocardiopsis ansamitocini]